MTTIGSLKRLDGVSHDLFVGETAGTQIIGYVLLDSAALLRRHWYAFAVCDLPTDAVPQFSSVIRNIISSIARWKGSLGRTKSERPGMASLGDPIVKFLAQLIALTIVLFVLGLSYLSWLAPGFLAAGGFAGAAFASCRLCRPRRSCEARP